MQKLCRTLSTTFKMLMRWPLHQQPTVKKHHAMAAAHVTAMAVTAATVVSAIARHAMRALRRMQKHPKQWLTQ